jgi:hypothetical protein
MLININAQGFAGGIDNWQIHMKGALNIVLGLVDVLLSPGPFPEIGGSPRSSISSHDPEGSLLFNEDEVSVKFLMAVYTWIDITGSVALGSSPSLAEHHERLLGGNSPPIRLDKVSGTQNWVMIFIAKIASLDTWKRTSQSNGTLSIIELVKKATALETKLKQALDDFSKDRKTCATFDRPAMPHLTPLSIHSAYLTELYASSALTYLHVVVSGAYPELPEIRGNVLITLELLKKLPSPLLLRVMWWPLLTTGSMVALGDEESFCRNIIKSCGINDSFFRVWIQHTKNLGRVLEAATHER